MAEYKQPGGKKAQASYLLMRDALQFAISHKLQWADFGYSHSKEIARPKRYWELKKNNADFLRNRNENNKRPSIQLSAVVRFF
ncbi:hypothetical protein QNN00_07575 [Bacillus velezensis]|nr:hypothetical protein [Bacillus velezensis]